MAATSASLSDADLGAFEVLLDPVRYNRHVDTVGALQPRVVASAHGPILVGDAIHDAFDRVRTLAGQPIIARPGKQPSTISSLASSQTPPPDAADPPRGGNDHAHPLLAGVWRRRVS